jgi:hypothetical protein
MKIETLVKLHSQFKNTEFSLKENCGDGYLCTHNEVYRKIRKQSLDYGVKYRVSGTTQWLDYMVFPLVSFQTILDKNEVPYIDNFNVLRRLAGKHPNMILPEKFIRDAFKRNYVLHESCHCITNNYFKKEIDAGSSDFPTAFSLEILKTFNSLLSEAFANAIERMSASFADSSTHIFLHVINSYVTYEVKTHELMRNTLQEIGIKNVFEIIFVSYFFNNILKYNHSSENIKNMIDKFVPSKILKNKKKYDLITEALLRCCRLNPRFRDETSTVFFSSLGLQAEYSSLSYENIIADEASIKYIKRTASNLYDLIF